MLDKEIREPLFDFLEEFYGKIRIFEEKITGLSRTDALGVIDGQLIGFEIKSDHDTYARLQRQTADYDELCDVNYLVIGRRMISIIFIMRQKFFPRKMQTAREATLNCWI